MSQLISLECLVDPSGLNGVVMSNNNRLHLSGSGNEMEYDASYKTLTPSRASTETPTHTSREACSLQDSVPVSPATEGTTITSSTHNHQFSTLSSTLGSTMCIERNTFLHIFSGDVDIDEGDDRPTDNQETLSGVEIRNTTRRHHGQRQRHRSLARTQSMPLMSSHRSHLSPHEPAVYIFPHNLLERISRGAGVESREGSGYESRSSEFVLQPEWWIPEGGEIDPHGLIPINIKKPWSEISLEAPPPPPFPSSLLPPRHQELWHQQHQQQQHFQAPLMAHREYYPPTEYHEGGSHEPGEYTAALPHTAVVDRTTAAAAAAREEVDEEECKQALRATKNRKKRRKRQTKFVYTFEGIAVTGQGDFPLSRRIIGQGGANMKRIVSLCPSAKIRLRGKGSGHGVGNSNDIPLQINLSCLEEAELEVAKEEISKLLTEIYKEYEK